LLVSALLMSSACGETTVVGSTCQAGTCPELPECRAAEQQYPVECSKETRTCVGGDQFGTDEDECNGCYLMLDEVNVDSPLGPCACTYCGIQLQRCFASGDADRDRLCIDIVRCAWHSGCVGIDCYCGEGVVFDECFSDTGGGPKGPCAPLIERALECSPTQSHYACVAWAYNTWDVALGRVAGVSHCVSGNPITQGDRILEGGTVLEGQAIVPKCR
jgi:hypothetical protein